MMIPLNVNCKTFFPNGCRKRKKLICGTEGEIVVAHGRLPSPALGSGEIECWGRGRGGGGVNWCPEIPEKITGWGNSKMAG